MSQLDLKRFSFMQMIELDACTRCGECIEWCPTFAEKQELDSITPLRKIEAVSGFVKQQYGLWARLFGSRPLDADAVQTHSTGTFDCTLCGRCAVVCPVHIDTRSLWISMRETLVDQGEYPEPLDHLRETVGAHHNISGDDNAERLIWSQNLPQVPEGVKGKEKAEVVYFVGCVGSFYPQSYGIPQSMVQIMERAGVDYTTLGSEEHCCGFPLIIAGMKEAALDEVRHNVEAVRKTGAKRLVASCPSCYHTWKHDYPQIMGEPLGFEVVHSTEMLEELVAADKLEFKPLEEKVTYHDPCDLGRTSGIYDAPRNVITAIPGVEFVEMKDHHEYSLCCGGGGDVEMADKELSAAVGARRIGQAQETEAKYLLSACQQCTRTLAGAARKNKVRVRVMDVTQFVARQLSE